MNESTFIHLILVAVISAALWFLYSQLYKDLVVDIFRQKIFELRDQLFDDAANGLIDFNHPGYCTLRRAMNGYIRFSHQARLVNVILFNLFTDKEDILNDPYSFDKQFTASISALDDNVADKMRSYRSRLRKYLALLLLTESPILTFLFLCFSVVTIIPYLLFRFNNAIGEHLHKKMIDEMQPVEAEAFALGKLS